MLATIFGVFMNKNIEASMPKTYSIYIGSSFAEKIYATAERNTPAVIIARYENGNFLILFTMLLYHKTIL